MHLKSAQNCNVSIFNLVQEYEYLHNIFIGSWKDPAINKRSEPILLKLQGVPKKVGFTTCNSSSKSHFFLGHLVDYGWIKINKMNMSMIELIDQALSSILIRINLCQYAHCSIKITRQVYFSFMNSFRQNTKCSQTK